MELLTESKAKRCAMVAFGPHPVEARVIKEVFEKLPKDTVMFNHLHDPATGMFGWLVASEEFKELEVGATLPKITVKTDMEGSVELLKEDSFADMLGDL